VQLKQGGLQEVYRIFQIPASLGNVQIQPVEKNNRLDHKLLAIIIDGLFSLLDPCETVYSLSMLGWGGF
jgi:hypothetical protein